MKLLNVTLKGKLEEMPIAIKNILEIADIIEESIYHDGDEWVKTLMIVLKEKQDEDV